MDGVLCDFISPAMEAHGNEFIYDDYPAGEWGVDKVLGLSDADFWAGINSKKSFWNDLKPYPWLHELIAAAKFCGESIKIATSPSKHAISYRGKREWVEQYLGIDIYAGAIELIMIKSKHLLAAPDRLLIDDSDKNINAFREAGGCGILFPQRWNSAHEFSKSPMFHVGRELQKLHYNNLNITKALK